jgi:hypothetical protein
LAFLDKEHLNTEGEAALWAAALGPSGLRSAICRISESLNATFEFDGATVTKLFM